MNRPLSRIAVVAATALVFTITGPAVLANAAPSATPVIPSASATTIDPEQLSPAQDRELAAVGIDPRQASIQTNGGYLLAVEGPDWAILASPNTPSSGVSTLSADFDAGLCSGRFTLPAKIAGKLEWGASDSCSSTAAPNDLYQQYIKVSLRQGNTDVWSLGRMYTKRTVTSTNSRYSRVATVHQTSDCDDTNQHHFDVIVYVTVHSVSFNPVVSGAPVSACGLK